MTGRIARFTFWLHFRFVRRQMKGQNRNAILADSLTKCEQLFNDAWPEDYPMWTSQNKPWDDE
jgi:hypothetical protein